jgi:pilus assembly protein TadC
MFQSHAPESLYDLDLPSIVKSSGLIPILAASIALGAMAACLLIMLSGSLALAIFASLLIALSPVAYAYHVKSAYDGEVESRAPEFFYDLSEHVKASGSVAKAIKRASRHDYGIISDEVHRMLSEIEHEGYDISSSLDEMARRVNNRYIYRAVSIIREALTTSSNLESILKVAAGEGRLYLSLKKERRSGISSSVFVIYFTSIIFLAVMALCLTSFMRLSKDMMLAAGASPAPVYGSAMPYYVLSVSIAVCAGLTIGQMRDGTVFGGFKDAAILLAVTFAVYELIVFPGYSLLGAYGL